jgi:hypothetical protein
MRPPGRIEGPPRRMAGRLPAGAERDCGRMAAAARNNRISAMRAGERHWAVSGTPPSYIEPAGSPGYNPSRRINQKCVGVPGLAQPRQVCSDENTQCVTFFRVRADFSRIIKEETIECMGNAASHLQEGKLIQRLRILLKCNGPSRFGCSPGASVSAFGVSSVSVGTPSA